MTATEETRLLDELDQKIDWALAWWAESGEGSPPEVFFAQLQERALERARAKILLSPEDVAEKQAFDLTLRQAQESVKAGRGMPAEEFFAEWEQKARRLARTWPNSRNISSATIASVDTGRPSRPPCAAWL